MADDLDRQYLDHEHDWERVDTIEWNTSYPDLNERFQTGVFVCSSDQCDAKRWAREETDQSQATEWM